MDDDGFACLPCMYGQVAAAFCADKDEIVTIKSAGGFWDATRGQLESLKSKAWLNDAVRRECYPLWTCLNRA